jgi:hypothetical protein
LGVEIFIAYFPDPADAPGAQRLDDRVQLAACGGEHVAHVAAVLAPVHDPGPGELVQPLGQQGGRHPRHAAAQLVEMLAAGYQLPDDQHGPPFV